MSSNFESHLVTCCRTDGVILHTRDAISVIWTNMLLTDSCCHTHKDKKASVHILLAECSSTEHILMYLDCNMHLVQKLQQVCLAVKWSVLRGSAEQYWHAERAWLHAMSHLKVSKTKRQLLLHAVSSFIGYKPRLSCWVIPSGGRHYPVNHCTSVLFLGNFLEDC